MLSQAPTRNDQCQGFGFRPSGVGSGKIRRDEVQEVVKTKDLCVGRGLLTRFDEVQDSQFRAVKFAFIDNVDALRSRAPDKLLSVIFKRQEENISLRVATYERCSSSFNQACDLCEKRRQQ